MKNRYEIDINPFFIQARALKTLQSREAILNCFPNCFLSNDNVKIYLFASNKEIGVNMIVRISSSQKIENRECRIRLKTESTNKDIQLGHIKIPILSKQTNYYIQRCSTNLTLDNFCEFLNASQIDIIIDGQASSLNITSSVPLILYCGYIFGVENLPDKFQRIANDKIHEYIVSIKSQEAKEGEEKKLEAINSKLNDLEKDAITVIRNTIKISKSLYGPTKNLYSSSIENNYNIEGIRKILTDPTSLYAVKALQSFCQENKLKSNTLYFINGLKTTPDKEQILKDLERIEKNIEWNNELGTKKWHIRRWQRYSWYTFLSIIILNLIFGEFALISLDSILLVLGASPILGGIIHLLWWAYKEPEQKSTGLSTITKNFIFKIDR